MYRHIFRFCVMTLTILTANLITGAITSYMISYKNDARPLVFTLIAMLITVAIFYPLFLKLESWVKDISLKAIKSGKHVAGKSPGAGITSSPPAGGSLVISGGIASTISDHSALGLTFCFISNPSSYKHACTKT